MQKAIFLDRDGTINIEKDYLYKKEDFEFIAGAIEGLKRLQDAGYLLVIITNQSGIARGFYTDNDFQKLNRWMVEEFKNLGILITKVYYCPHHPMAVIKKYRKNCDCRKPEIGMFMKAVRDFDIDLNKSFAIGDKIRDCAICERTGCRGYLIADNEKRDIVSDVQNGKYKNLRYRKNLLECVEEIVVMEE